MPDRMLSDLRRIVERVDTVDGFDAGLSVDFISEHGPALLARLEAVEAAVLAEREACARAVEAHEMPGAEYANLCCLSNVAGAIDRSAAAIRARTKRKRRSKAATGAEGREG